MWDVRPDVFNGHSCARSAPEAHGVCIWEFDGAEWKVKLIRENGRGVAGEPPRIQGRFRGQLRATPCVLSEVN